MIDYPAFTSQLDKVIGNASIRKIYPVQLELQEYSFISDFNISFKDGLHPSSFRETKLFLRFSVLANDFSMEVEKLDVCDFSSELIFLSEKFCNFILGPYKYNMNANSIMFCNFRSVNEMGSIINSDE